jgi:hypothetical protein
VCVCVCPATHVILNSQNDINPTFVRFHGLLDDDMSVVLESDDGKSLSFSYANVFSVFDFLVSIDMKPVVELSFMPEALASGATTIFHYKGNITPPRDYGVWAGVIASLVKALVDRYGIGEVRSWRFEVWNERKCALTALAAYRAHPSVMSCGTRVVHLRVRVEGSELRLLERDDRRVLHALQLHRTRCQIRRSHAGPFWLLCPVLLSLFEWSELSDVANLASWWAALPRASSATFRNSSATRPRWRRQSTSSR